MRKLLVVVVLMALAVQVEAQDRRDGVTTRTATFDRRSGDVIPTATRLHPVIGSLNRTSHFNNPLTHKARYTGVLFNPILGTFSTKTFRR